MFSTYFFHSPLPLSLSGIFFLLPLASAHSPPMAAAPGPPLPPPPSTLFPPPPVAVAVADAASQLHHATKNPRRRCRRPAPPSAPSPGRRSPTCGARDSGCAGATTAIPATPDGPRTTSWAGKQGAERPGGSTPGRRFREGVDERGKFPAPFLNGSYARCFAMFVLL